jgi:novobiocin biosynthesis protein NovU/D-mycarose 3-C-methyltransferase
MLIDRCRACDADALERFLDLGTQALANRFLRPGQEQQPEPRYPLRLAQCRECGLVQIDCTVPREELFRDYIYFSGTAETLHRHATWLATTLGRKYGLGPRDLVLEAASNDGSVLKAFRWQGQRVLGVEPASNVAEQAREIGVETVCDFFDERVARRLRQEHGPARVVLARHVLAHVSDLHGFVRGLKIALAADGVAVVEVPHAAELYRRLELDTIYHEHLCYFTAAVLYRLLRRFGLVVIEVERLSLHGGSLLVHAAHAGVTAPVAAGLGAVLREEETLGLGRPWAWRLFARRAAGLRDAIPAFLQGLRRDGLRLAGYGAPAKGNVLLQYCGIGPELLPYLVDRSPLKQGLLTPGRHLPIFAPEKLLEDRPDVTLLLAWNLADEIVRQQEDYRRLGGRFAVPVPAPRLLEDETWSLVS